MFGTGSAQLPPAGTLVGLVAFAAGLAWFSRMPADADFVADLLGPSLVVAVGRSQGAG